MGLTSRHLSEEAASVGGKKLSRSEADRYIVSGRQQHIEPVAV